VAQLVSTTDWRHRSKNDALRGDALQNIAPLNYAPRDDSLRSDALRNDALRRDAPRPLTLSSVRLREAALQDAVVYAIPGRMVVDLVTRAVSVELPWVDYRRGSTSATGVDVELNAIVDRRIALDLTGSARAKRAFDIFATLVTAPLWMPLLGFLALLVTLTSRGKAFYAQERVGRDGRAFRCVKLRTMAFDAERRLELLLSSDPVLRSEYEASFKLRRDPRITRIGRVLRQTGLDELPQLFNVLRGTMSLVGPRPLLLPETPNYGPYLQLVLTVRPGLTGPWQVSGRNDLPYPLRVALAVEYVLTRTFWSDLRTLLRTVLLVFRPKSNGAY
jgi:lipopolysaccharide/colanic/teichoic acid biosynthesis glycosyltransferase